MQILDEVARSAQVLATGDADEQQAAIVQQYLTALVCSTGRSPGKARPRRAETIDPTSDQPVGLLGRHAARVMANVPPVGDLPENYRTSDSFPEHRHVGGSAGPAGQNSAECACGVTFDGFDTHAEATALLDDHIARNTEQHPPFCAYAPGCGGLHNTEWVTIPATGRDGEIIDHGIVFAVVSVAAEWETYAESITSDARDGRPLLHLAATWPDGTNTQLRFTPEEWREASGAIESAHGIATVDPRWATKPPNPDSRYNVFAAELHAFWCSEEYANGCGICCSRYEYMPASGDGWEPGGGGVIMPALAVAAEASNEDGVERRNVSLHFPGPDRMVALTPGEAVRLLAAAHRALTTLTDYEEGRS